MTLLEEPQAAFYAWLDALGDCWRRRVAVGDLILVCDVGGGTTDFSLIAVGERDGDLALERVAVGEHILLGGDNMDLALARLLQQRLEAAGPQASTPGSCTGCGTSAGWRRKRCSADPTADRAAGHAARPRLAADRRHHHHVADARRCRIRCCVEGFSRPCERRDAGPAAARRPPGARACRMPPIRR